MSETFYQLFRDFGLIFLSITRLNMVMTGRIERDNSRNLRSFSKKLFLYFNLSLILHLMEERKPGWFLMYQLNPLMALSLSKVPV